VLHKTKQTTEYYHPVTVTTTACTRIGSRLICFYRRILYFDFHQLNSSSVYVVRRPCSDFTDMLRRLI